MKAPIKSLTLSASVVAVVGLVLAPASVFAVGTNVRAVVGYTISVANSVPGNLDLAITPTAGGSATSASDTVTTTTNDANGYQLSIAGATSTLVNGANTLTAVTGTPASPSAITNGTWGFRYDDATAFTGFTNASTTAQSNQASLTVTKWAGMPTSATVIKQTSAAATSGDATVIFYGAMADTSKPSGNYTDAITYTVAGR